MAAPGAKPLSIGVLVDLEWAPDAGGHVKCWERFAEAARSFGGQLDMTIYYLGEREHVVEIADNARYVILPPTFGTNRVRFLRNGGGDTDMAPRNAELAKRLTATGHDIYHATDAFTFARTAHGLSRRTGVPLVSSIHTDLPKFTQVYTREIIERQLGSGLVGRLVLDHLGFDRMAANAMRKRVERLLRGSQHVLVSREQDSRRLSKLIGPNRVSRLRRGIDKLQFNPRHRDRERLLRDYGIPEDRPVVLFAGRLDDSKKVMTLANAARILLDHGQKLHVMAVGRGADADRIRRLLGPNATLPGSLPQRELAWLYASADLFVFPSESEVAPNVVLEAKASGLPVLISAIDGGAQFIGKSGEDGILIDDPSPEAWATVMAPLVGNAVTRADLAYHARKRIEDSWPSWEDVLQEDLLPIWQRLARRNAQA